MVNKVYIDKTKIETRDNSNNLTFSTNYRYLKSNAQSKTRVSGFVTATLPYGMSYDDDSQVATDVFGTCSTIYLSKQGDLYEGNAWQIQFWFDENLNTPFEASQVSILGPNPSPSYPGWINQLEATNTSYVKLEYKAPSSSSFTTLKSYNLLVIGSSFYPQPNSLAAYYASLNPSPDTIGTDMPSYFNTYGTGTYRVRILSGWNAGRPASGTLHFPVFEQTKGSSTINAEVTA